MRRAQEQGITLYKNDNNNNLSKTVSREQFSLFEADSIESEWNEREKEKRERAGGVVVVVVGF